MRYLDGQAERCLATISAIARSPEVREFIVGYTSNVAQRQAAYRRVLMPHLVVLAAQLGQDDALRLESALQDAIKQGDQRSLLYRKYDKRRIGRTSARSAGGKALGPAERICAVYMAWRREPSAVS